MLCSSAEQSTSTQDITAQWPPVQDRHAVQLSGSQLQTQRNNLKRLMLQLHRSILNLHLVQIVLQYIRLENIPHWQRGLDNRLRRSPQSFIDAQDD